MSDLNQKFSELMKTAVNHGFRVENQKLVYPQGLVQSRMSHRIFNIEYNRETIKRVPDWFFDIDFENLEFVDDSDTEN